MITWHQIMITWQKILTVCQILSSLSLLSCYFNGKHIDVFYKWRIKNLVAIKKKWTITIFLNYQPIAKKKKTNQQPRCLLVHQILANSKNENTWFYK